MRNELRKKHYLGWGEVFSKKDDLKVDNPVELVTISRKSVAKPGEVEFIDPHKKKKRTKKKKKQNSFLQPSWDELIILFFLAMGVHLVFTSGGLLELYQSKSQILEGQKYLVQLQGENKALSTEIGKLKNNSRYQKKIAREHLGAIAHDEFLIIFSD